MLDREVVCNSCATMNSYTKQEIRTDFAVDKEVGELYRYSYISCSWCLKRITIKRK